MLGRDQARHPMPLADREIPHQRTTTAVRSHKERWTGATGRPGSHTVQPSRRTGASARPEDTSPLPAADVEVPRDVPDHDPAQHNRADKTTVRPPGNQRPAVSE